MILAFPFCFLFLWSSSLPGFFRGEPSMGNCCCGIRSKVDNSLDSRPTSEVNLVSPFSHGSQGTTKYSSKTSHPSAASSMTKANSGQITIGSLPIPKTECDILLSPHLKAFSYSDLRNATRNFRPDSLIGEGGFGYVYKGWMDEQSLGPAAPGSGMVVAVKNLKSEGLQGHKEWLSEVNYLGKLHHPNLVKLIGYCLEGENRLLVYEYMPKGSLENHLFRKSTRPLSWAARIKVAIGAARGLFFLHDSEQPVIYRDFKASNILLDQEFNAKLSDFGLAKAGPTGDRTHVTTQVLGTEGYAAPEYIATGRLTAKCDVYSFGVVLLELLSGRRAVDKTKVGAEENLVEWARPYLSDRRKLFRIMDIRLEGQYSQRGAFTVALLALQCIGEAKIRPQMSEVLAALQNLPARRDNHRSLPEFQKLASPNTKPQLRKSYPTSPATVTPRSSPLPTCVKSAQVTSPQKR